MELFGPPNKYLSCGSAGRAQVALDTWSGPHAGGPSSGAGKEGHQLPPVGAGASPRAQDRPALRGLQNRVKLSDGGLSAVWPVPQGPLVPGAPALSSLPGGLSAGHRAGLGPRTSRSHWRSSGLCGDVSQTGQGATAPQLPSLHMRCLGLAFEGPVRGTRQHRPGEPAMGSKRGKREGLSDLGPGREVGPLRHAAFLSGEPCAQGYG